MIPAVIGAETSPALIAAQNIPIHFPMPTLWPIPIERLDKAGEDIAAPKPIKHPDRKRALKFGQNGKTNIAIIETEIPTLACNNLPKRL